MTSPSSGPLPVDKIDGRLERGRRRQEVLLDAARELLIENGYRGMTLEALISRAGGSRVTIYRAFGGKSGLVSAIIARCAGELAESVVSSKALKLPPRETLARFGMQLIATWNSPEGRAINRAVVSEGLNAPDLLCAWYQSGFEPSISALSRYFDVQISLGRLIGIDSHVAARQFIMLLIGELAYPLIAGLPGLRDNEACVARCVDLVVRAYDVQEACASRIAFEAPRAKSHEVA